MGMVGGQGKEKSQAEVLLLIMQPTVIVGR